MTLRLPLLPAAVLTLLTLALPAQATGLGTTNQAALARGYALPVLGDSTVAPIGGGHWRFAVDLSSEYVLDQDGNEELLLDGESQHYVFTLRRGLGERFDWSLELPLIHASGGFMDDLIEDWHSTFSLPNGGREDAPTDRYLYRYTRQGQTLFEVDDEGTRPGDARLGLGWQWTERLALRAQLKLPTGDGDRLSGGSTGGAVWGDLALPFASDFALRGTVSAGLSAKEEPEVLGEFHNALVPFGGLGLGLRVLPALELLGQLYLHGPLYSDTDIDALERPGAQLTLGGRLCLSAGPCFELSFQEDLAVGASPDFGLRFALASR